MKIAKELRTLSREHHISLSLANKAINTYQSMRENKVLELCRKIEKYFEPSFRSHFLTEENMLFYPLMRVVNNQEKSICRQLIKEHEELIDLSLILTNHPEKLLVFGELLKQHTRTEERIIFPKIALMTKENRQRLLEKSNQHNAVERFF